MKEFMQEFESLRIFVSWNPEKQYCFVGVCGDEETLPSTPDKALELSMATSSKAREVECRKVENPTTRSGSSQHPGFQLYGRATI